MKPLTPIAAASFALSFITSACTLSHDCHELRACVDTQPKDAGSDVEHDGNSDQPSTNTVGAAHDASVSSANATDEGGDGDGGVDGALGRNPGDDAASSGSPGAAVGGAGGAGSTGSTGGAFGAGGLSSGGALGGSPPAPGDGRAARGGAGGSAGNGVSVAGTTGAGGGPSSASGGGGTAANAIDGGAIASRFLGGPCVTTGDDTTVEAFARGANQSVYRRVLAGATPGDWTALKDLDGTMVDAASDLDCNGWQGAIDIAALGQLPVKGSYLHAVGAGTQYSAWARELAPDTFDTSPAVLANGPSAFTAGAVSVSGNLTLLGGVSSGTFQAVSFPIHAFASGPDLESVPRSTYFAAFDTAGKLALYTGSVGWSSAFLDPPSAGSFQYSPSICVGPNTSSNWGRPHLVVVAGGRLWYSKSAEASPVSFSAWEPISDAPVSTAPDCTVTSDGTVHVVALDGNGQMVYARGISGSFSTSNVRAY